MFSRVTALTLRVNGYPAAFSALSSGCSLMVKHDRQNQRFTVNPGSGAGKQREPGLTLRCRGRSCMRARGPLAACWMSLENAEQNSIYKSSNLMVLYPTANFAYDMNDLYVIRFVFSLPTVLQSYYQQK